MQGLLHLSMRAPSAFWLVRAFKEMNVELDSKDFQNRTPFSIGIDQQISKHDDNLPKSLLMFMDNDVNIDCAD